ncbi:MAG: hypothetical protein LJE83_12325 [Gammaproteobacteria bacterium]|nr:hypothetical protein [Gammaproteobacteria bacterium]
MFENQTVNFILVMLGLVFIWVFALRINTRAAHTLVQRVASQQSCIRQYEDVRQLCRAVHYLHPTLHAGIDYVVNKTSPEQKPYIQEWFHTNIPQPKPEELEQALQAISGVDPVKDHAALRLKEYPSVGDQLDAAYKARLGDNKEQIRLDNLITRVKEKYPKSDSSL